MRRAIGVTLGALVLYSVSLMLAPESLSKGTFRDCGTARHYLVRAKGVSCKFARRWTRRIVDSSSEPPGWKCEANSGGKWV